MEAILHTTANIMNKTARKYIYYDVVVYKIRMLCIK